MKRSQIWPKGILKLSHDATVWAWKQTLPSSAKLVLLCLADCHNRKTGRCDPSNDHIKGKTGLNVKTISKARKLLSDAGLASFTFRKDTSQLSRLNIESIIGDHQKRSSPKTVIPENGGCPPPKAVITPPQKRCTNLERTRKEPGIRGNEKISTRKRSLEEDLKDRSWAAKADDIENQPQ